MYSWYIVAPNWPDEKKGLGYSSEPTLMREDELKKYLKSLRVMDIHSVDIYKFGAERVEASDFVTLERPF